MSSSIDPSEALTYAINALKVIFAMSPLIAVGYVLYNAFEDDEDEDIRRNKKEDFVIPAYEG